MTEAKFTKGPSRRQMQIIIKAGDPPDELSKKRYGQVCAYITKLEQALDEIATGEIAGEPNNYKDTLAICRDVARKALK